MGLTRCVYCRAAWPSSANPWEDLETPGEVKEEGYVNLADELGLSGVRDTRTSRSWGLS